MDHPGAAVVALGLPICEDERAICPIGGGMGVPTMATDGRRILYHPKFVENHTNAEVLAVYAHEVWHVMLMHPFRRGARLPMAWNIACDKAVNHIVENVMGLKLPGWGVPGVAEKCAEELYDVEDQPPNDECEMHGWVNDPGGEDGKSLSEGDRAAAESDARELVQRAITVAKQAGQLPADLARMFGDLLEPRVPWQEILARFLDQWTRNDYSWQRPNFRHLQRGIVLPGLHTPAVPRVIFAADTSGSIDEGMLQEVCSEMFYALEQAAAGADFDLPVLWCDTDVTPQLINEPSELEPRGGGGTRYAPVFEWVDEHEPDVRAVVYITDGYCSDFGPEPEYDVLWILTSSNHDNFDPPFGEVAYTL